MKWRNRLGGSFSNPAKLYVAGGSPINRQAALGLGRSCESLVDLSKQNRLFKRERKHLLEQQRQVLARAFEAPLQGGDLMDPLGVKSQPWVTGLY
jgi:hypothetical protein